MGRQRSLRRRFLRRRSLRWRLLGQRSCEALVLDNQRLVPLYIKMEVVMETDFVLAVVPKLGVARLFLFSLLCRPLFMLVITIRLLQTDIPSGITGANPSLTCVSDACFNHRPIVLYRRIITKSQQDIAARPVRRCVS